MNNSFSASKQVAKDINIVKYLPELQIYELSVVWETDHDSSTLFLPEHFLYPFSVEKKKTTQSTQASTPTIHNNQQAISCVSEVSAKLESQQPLPIKRKASKRAVSPIAIKEELNFDSIMLSCKFKAYFQTLRRQVMHVKVEYGKKKRKF